MKVCFLSGLKDVAGREELDIVYRGPLSGLLEALCDRHGPALRARLLDPEHPSGRNAFVKILVDGRDVQVEDPDLTGTETVFLFLPIAGG